METQSEATAAAQFENHLMQKLIDTAEGVIRNVCLIKESTSL